MAKIKRLQFNEAGTEVKIIFSNDKESISFESKISVAKALADLWRKKKITEAEFDELVMEVVKSKLPSSTNDDEEGIVKVTVIHINLESIVDSIIAQITRSHPNEPILSAFYKKCECGDKHPHGTITHKNGTTVSIASKKQAKAMLQFLFVVQKTIDENELKSLTDEIEKSDLPEEIL